MSTRLMQIAMVFVVGFIVVVGGGIVVVGRAVVVGGGLSPEHTVSRMWRTWSSHSSSKPSWSRMSSGESLSGTAWQSPVSRRTRGPGTSTSAFIR